VKWCKSIFVDCLQPSKIFVLTLWLDFCGGLETLNYFRDLCIQNAAFKIHFFFQCTGKSYIGGRINMHKNWFGDQRGFTSFYVCNLSLISNSLSFGLQTIFSACWSPSIRFLCYIATQWTSEYRTSKYQTHSKTGYLRSCRPQKYGHFRWTKNNLI
jgi:hypothetical protein